MLEIKKFYDGIDAHIIFLKDYASGEFKGCLMKDNPNYYIDNKENIEDMFIKTVSEMYNIPKETVKVYKLNHPTVNLFNWTECEIFHAEVSNVVICELYLPVFVYSINL